ncbi:olfactory receptor 14A16-like [Podarcis muralis]
MDLMNEKMDLMTVVVNNCGQTGNIETETIQGPTYEPVSTGQVQKIMEEDAVAPQTIQMERPEALQEHKPLSLKIEVGVGQGESGAEEVLNFGETLKYAFNYLLDCTNDLTGRFLLMKEKISNESSVSEFLLLEFSAIRKLQILHFSLFLALYLATVFGNLLIISAIAFDHHLHTPMYFFLMNLAIQDLGAVSVTIPKSIVNSLMNTRHISYTGCVAQVILFVFFLSSDISLLTVMAYDRYVAICNPLQYEMLMNRAACKQMVAGVWVSGFLNAVMHTSATFATPFCSNIVNQFFCEIPQLLTLACSNFYLMEIGALVVTIILVSGCFVFIVVTYVHIFTAVLKIPSVEGRKKAFSTCIPHLVVFSVFFFIACFAYLRPPSKTPSDGDFALTVMYSLVPPMFNPIIYSMRNKEIKNALSKLLGLRKSPLDIFSRLVLKRCN